MIDSDPHKKQDIDSGAHETSELIDRINAAREDLDLSISSLHELSPEEQADVIDDIAYNVYQSTQSGVFTKSALNLAREKGDSSSAEKIVKQRRDAISRISRQVAFMSGIELEDPEAQKTEYQAKLADRVGGLEMESLSEEEIMHELGFLTVDETTGEERFSFPEDVFPPYIIEKWNRYTSSVESHLRAYDKIDKGLSNDPEEVAQWDQTRRIMHNGVAKDIQEFLQLNNWDQKKAREFVTKMLEKRIPNRDTRESQLTTDAILRNLSQEKNIIKGIVDSVHTQE